MDPSDEQRRTIADTHQRWTPAIGIIQDRQRHRKRKIVLMIPEGQEIRPGDIVWLDDVPGELTVRMPDGSILPLSEFDTAETVPATEPEDSGGDDYDALERELEEIADLLLGNEDKAR